MKVHRSGRIDSTEVDPLKTANPWDRRPALCQPGSLELFYRAKIKCPADSLSRPIAHQTQRRCVHLLARSVQTLSRSTLPNFAVDNDSRMLLNRQLFACACARVESFELTPRSGRNTFSPLRFSRTARHAESLAQLDRSKNI